MEMEEGTLFEKAGQHGVNNVVVEVEGSEIEKFDEAEDGLKMQISVIVLEGFGDDTEKVLVKKSYDQFFCEMGTLDAVKVLAVNGDIKFKEEHFEPGAVILLEGTWNVESN